MRKLFTPFSYSRRISTFIAPPSLAVKPLTQDQTWDWRRYSAGALLLATLYGAKVALKDKEVELPFSFRFTG
jgi:hypothetical protein